jgi:hypothetical protein
MNNYSEISIQLSQSALTHHCLKTLEEVENDIFFTISASKDQVYRLKRDFFQKNKLHKINVIANNTNFGYVSNKIFDSDICILPSYLLKVDQISDELLEALDNSLVISTSNIFADIGSITFSKLYENLPNSIFVMHDYDNHHWISNNIQLAIFSDVYVPAHQDENLIASRLNPNVIGSIPCGSNQWSADFINGYGKINLLNKRSLLPLGKYYFYQKFIHRNKLITTLSKVFPTIGFVETDFHNLTPEQKWLEWSHHALHWIAPVLNDLPIRFFDALITGGIPIIPSGLKPFVESLQIPDDYYAIYRPLDLMDPKPLISTQGERFEKLGKNGIMERHEFALEHFHIDKIINKLIKNTLKLYDIERLS